ncbi:MAG: tryptophan 7-halogenase [Sandaracinus sp.]
MSAHADVLVVGLGSAGAAVAQALAAEGRRVVAIDKREVGETGARWVNAVPEWCFERARLRAPSGGELFVAHHDASSRAMHLLAPEGGGRLTLRAPPVLHVDMRRLVDRLVHDAIGAGVTVRRGRIASVELEGGRVVALRVEDGGREERIAARLVVDASGLGGAVRERVPQLARVCPAASPENLCVAAQFQHEVRDRAGLEAFLETHGASPGHDIAFPSIAGGFSTLTVFTSPALDRVGVLTGSIPATGAADAKEMMARFLAREPWIGPRLWGGRGAIPLRRPYRVLARAGVALIGDAACQVHSAHGSGVGIGLVAARMLADAVRGADDPGADEVLAQYERSFHREHGGVLTAADAFRRHVQGASAAELSTLIAEGLLDEALAMAALAQRPTRPSPALVLRLAPRALRNPGPALRFFPIAARTAVLDRVAALVGSRRVGASVERSIDSLVGEAPRHVGPGAWREPGSRDRADDLADTSRSREDA